MDQIDAPVGPELVDERRVCSQHRPNLVAAVGNAGRGKCLDRVELDASRAVLNQVLGDRLVAGAQRLFERRTTGADTRRIDLGAVLDQQRHALGEIALGRGPQLLDEQPGGGHALIAQP